MLQIQISLCAIQFQFPFSLFLLYSLVWFLKPKYMLGLLKGDAFKLMLVAAIGRMLCKLSCSFNKFGIIGSNKL